MIISISRIQTNTYMRTYTYAHDDVSIGSTLTKQIVGHRQRIVQFIGQYSGALFQSPLLPFLAQRRGLRMLPAILAAVNIQVLLPISSNLCSLLLLQLFIRLLIDTRLAQCLPRRRR